MTSSRLGWTGMAGRAQNQICQKCSHKWVLSECRREGVAVMLLIVVEHKAETLPAQPFVAELDVCNSLLACLNGFVEVVLPHLGTRYPMTDKINREQIGV